ncbi:sensor histidine kinase [Actinomadura roseirufa]|uniref:sensor histidine kinase n=1 Tax=Actinomadura roseirufa TaxID=2094049 RepID=UPI0010417A22|nr:histidine kinase [Actinomadura roseirufa]
MRSSAADRNVPTARPAAGAAGVRPRINAAFRLLMQVRLLMAGVTLFVLAVRGLSWSTFVMVLCVALLSWLVARHVEEIVPRLLDHPLLVALDLCVCFAVLAVCGPSGPFFLSTVATAAAAGLLYRWQGMLIVSVVQIAGYFVTLAFAATRGDAGTFQELAGQPAYYPLVGFAGVALRRLFEDHAGLEEARLGAEVAAAAAEERARLAREMHDSLAKTLRGMALAAAALPAWIAGAPERAEREAVRLAASIETASLEARGLLTDLRDTTITEALPTAVRAAARGWAERLDVTAHIEVSDDADLPLRHRYEVLAILGEALANVERHARARTVWVRLARTGGEVVLTVRDDGRGFATVPLEALARDGHYGLVGLHERAERAGGALLISSEPGAGTTLVVRVADPSAGATGRLAEVS